VHPIANSWEPLNSKASLWSNATATVRVPQRVLPPQPSHDDPSIHFFRQSLPMSSTANALKCPICLDTCVDPVAPPCGHITCHSCIRLHILASPHPFLATCPMCSDVFATVMPDLDVIPLEYHEFIYPPLCFIALADGNDHSQEAIDFLKHENSILRIRDCVANLKSRADDVDADVQRLLDVLRVADHL